MNKTTVIGVIAGIGALIIGFIFEGGHISSLFQASAAMIVFGGTAGAVIASFSLEELKNFPQWLRVAFTKDSYRAEETFLTLVRFAERARRDGLLSLEEELEKIEDKYTRQGLQLIIDGTDPDITSQILESNIAVLERRHKVGISVFEAAGGYAPTMGIIGTVMGLVHVLGNLSDPDTLSHSIAAAFIATLYGVVSANLLWLPIAAKLKQKNRAEVAVMEMLLDGILSIQAGENPAILKEKMKTHLGYIPATQASESESKSTVSKNRTYSRPSVTGDRR